MINSCLQKIQNKNIQFYLVLDSPLIKDNLKILNKKIKVLTSKEVSNILINNKDMAISFLYNRVISKKTIDRFHTNIFNIHPSLLPYNRGSNPYTWTILNETMHGVTIHYLDEKIDHGPIIYQKKIKINRLHTAEQLRQITVPILQETLVLLIRNWINNKRMEVIKRKKNRKVNTQQEFERQRNIEMSKKSKEYVIIKKLCAYSIGSNGGLEVFFKGKKYRISIDVNIQEL